MIISITNVAAPEIEMYSSLNENQLSHYFEPDKNGIFISETENVIDRALNAGYKPMSVLIERTKYERAYSEEDEVNLNARRVLDRMGDIPVYVTEDSVLRELTSTKITRGILCAMRRRELPSIEEVTANARRVVLLEDVMNPTNVGAIFRSAAALNMDAVILTSKCADPLYRRAARVAMGTVFQIPWTYSENPVDRLHELGFKTVAMALRDNSVSLSDERLKEEPKLAIIMGTESTGLKDETIAKSDYFVKIPMTHGVDSLNVAAASAVAFWELGR